MRTTRLLDRDDATGTTEYYHFDPQTHGFTIERRQDVTALVEANKAIANDNAGWKGDLHHVASFPLTIVMDLAQQGIMSPAGAILDDARFRRWLNAPENRVWRVKYGQV